MRITHLQLRKLIKEALKIGNYEIPTPLPRGAIGSKATHRQRALDLDLLGSLSDVEKVDPHSASELARKTQETNSIDRTCSISCN